jgi:hypothetical protein
MSAASKSGWGQVKPSGIVAHATESNGGGKRAPVLIENMDVSKLEFGPVEKGDQDRYCRIKYDGGRIEFSFADLPNFARMTFKAGPFQGNKDMPRREGDEKWSTRIELSQAQYDKWVAIEEKFNNDMEKHRVEAYPHDKKKKEQPISVEVFRSKFRTSVVASDPEKGYAASMKVAIKHEEGKQPRVQRLYLVDGPNGEKKCTRPKPGNIHQLAAKCAVACGGTVERGGYFGNFGHGLKVTLTYADIVINRQESGGPAPNYSNVEWTDELPPDAAAYEEAEAAPPAKKARPSADDEESANGEPNGAESFDQEAMDAAMAAQGNP